MIRVAFDVGTNTFLMVIGEQTADGDWHILYDAHSIARLGEGVNQTKYISEEAYKRAKQIAQEYKSICDEYPIQEGYGVATSAVRDAENGVIICEQLSKDLGYEIRRISGEEEARLSFIGSCESYTLQTVIDIGGGSTEYVTGENNHILSRKSLQIGAVRLYEHFFTVLPPTPESVIAARHEIRMQLKKLPQTEQSIVTQKPMSDILGGIIGVGGTFTTLAAMDLHLQEFQTDKVHLHSLSLPAISDMTDYLCRNPLTELLQNPAIHPQRADILPAGALILEESLKFFGISQCTVSTRGLRYGVLKDNSR